MKRNDDLLAAFDRMHVQYAAGRIDRSILRGWVLGLAAYDGPVGDAVHAAKEWFVVRRDDADEVRTADLRMLLAVLDAGRRPP